MSYADFQILNFDVGIKLCKLPEMGEGGAGGGEIIQTMSKRMHFFGKPSLTLTDKAYNKVNNKSLKPIRNFVYLGSIIQSSNMLIAYIKRLLS